MLLNTLMGLPPVVVGLAVYLALSRSGPFGSLGLLFTPAAMVIAQTILVTPIIAALARQTIEDMWEEYRDELTAMNVGPFGRMATLIWDGRFSLVVTLLAGFGRAAAEVGAIIIVGGNINGFTRTMTTAIALETSKGDLPLAMGLGAVLITVVIAVNALVPGLSGALARRSPGESCEHVPPISPSSFDDISVVAGTSTILDRVSLTARGRSADRSHRAKRLGKDHASAHRNGTHWFRRKGASPGAASKRRPQTAERSCSNVRRCSGAPSRVISATRCALRASRTRSTARDQGAARAGRSRPSREAPGAPAVGRRAATARAGACARPRIPLSFFSTSRPPVSIPPQRRRSKISFAPSPRAASKS